MKNSRISGFQWAMTVFVFFVITMTLTIVLRDFQTSIGVKRFVFDIKDLAPFIASIVCILVFKYKKEQLAGLKFSFSLKVVERILLALILPLIIFVIGMFSFNTFADSFILLQTSDLSVSLITILIGHILMAFVTEFGFRSYLQNILELKMNTFFSSIVVGIIYSIFTATTTYGMAYAGYHFLYTFMFSMIVGELIRATQGRTIYIATIFHATMTFILVFLFSEETGDLFSMKVIAISTTIVGLLFIIISLIVRAFLYKNTNQTLDEVEPNNYFDHTEEDDFEGHKSSSNEHVSDNHRDTTNQQHSNLKSDHHDKETELKDNASYKEDLHSSVVSNAKEEINEVEDNHTTKND